MQWFPSEYLLPSCRLIPRTRRSWPDRGNLSSVQPHSTALTSSRTVTPTNFKKTSHPPTYLLHAAEATWLQGSTSFPTRSKPVQLFKEQLLLQFLSWITSALEECQNPEGSITSALWQAACWEGTGQAVSTAALHYAQTQFCCWMIDNNYWMSLF